MNLNKLAKTVAEKEGKKKEVSIAQIKEILRIILIELAKYPYKEVISLLSRYKED